MTTEEKQAITIDTLTKRLRSAIDSAQDHQRNCIQKEIQLCKAKDLLREAVDDIPGVTLRGKIRTFLHE